MPGIVKIFQSGNVIEFQLAKDLLEQAEIKVLTKNFEGRHLYGRGVLGLGYNLVLGPYELHVLETDFERARNILKVWISGQSHADIDPLGELEHRRLLHRLMVIIFSMAYFMLFALGLFSRYPKSIVVFVALIPLLLGWWLKARQLRIDLIARGYEWIKTLEAMVLERSSKVFA